MAPAKVSRRDLARRIGITSAMVRHLEVEGRISPCERDAMGRVFYAEADAAALEASYVPGPKALRHRGNVGRPAPHIRATIAVRVFACFKAGTTDLAAVVEETMVDPDVVERLWQRWKTPLGEAERLRQEKEAARIRREAQRTQDRVRFLERRERIALIATGRLDDETIKRLARDL